MSKWEAMGHQKEILIGILHLLMWSRVVLFFVSSFIAFPRTLFCLLALPLCSSSAVIVNTAIMDCVRLNYSLCRALGELWRNAVTDKNASSSAPLQWWRAPARVDQREPFPQGPPS